MSVKTDKVSEILGGTNMNALKLSTESKFVFDDWSIPKEEYKCFMEDVLKNYSAEKSPCSYKEFLTFCDMLFWQGCKYRMVNMKSQITAGFMPENVYQVFVSSLNYALSVSLESYQAINKESFSFLVAMGKIAFNSGCHYADHQFEYAIQQIYNNDDYVL